MQDEFLRVNQSWASLSWKEYGISRVVTFIGVLFYGRPRVQYVDIRDRDYRFISLIFAVFTINFNTIAKLLYNSIS
jgi:hypothetical protein